MTHRVHAKCNSVGASGEGPRVPEVRGARDGNPERRWHAAIVPTKVKATLRRNACAASSLTTILVDGLALSDGSTLRGIGTYLRRIISGLTERDGFAVRVLADPAVKLAVGAEAVPVRGYLPLRFRWTEHDLLLPYQMARQRCDVFFSPAQHPPRRSRMPWVQTLHDLIPLTRPDPLLAADRRRWLRVGARLRDAEAVVAVSRFSAEEAIRHFGLDRNRIHVIPNGVDPAVFHPAEHQSADPPYLLYVAAWGPHKGFDEALAVVAELARRGYPHRLVLAGPQDDWMLSRIRAAVAASPAPERVEIAGYVDDLASLYRGAEVFLMSSRCEGFGLPVLEAMACGTPVVAFGNSSLPEVVGDGGALVADGDVAAMVEQVQHLIDDRQARAQLSERGVARAARFRWEDAVDRYAELFASVARSASP